MGLHQSDYSIRSDWFEGGGSGGGFKGVLNGNSLQEYSGNPGAS